MELSIIILNYKTKGLLKQCLKGIQLQHLKLNHEIIVVDNASNDSSVAMVRENFPLVKIIESSTNRGFAAGMNLGLKEAQGKYYLLLNTDIAIMEQAIESMYNFMESHPDVGLLGPKLINPDGTVQTSCRQFPTIKAILARRTPLGKLPWFKKRLKDFLMLDWDHQSNHEVDWMIGACLMARREAVQKVGLMDERFFLYLEDVDWARRFWQAGFKVYYLAEAEMVHYHQRLSAAVPGLGGLFSYATRIHIASAIKYFLKYWGK